MNRFLASILVVVGVGLTACGDDVGANGGTDVRCGSGTTLIDGECVANGDGGGDGDAPVRCERGTALDETSGACIVDDSACAEGTSLIDGVCVADDVEPLPDAAVQPDPIECDDGTVLDESSSRCVLDDSACAEGTVLSGGACIPDGTVICGQGTELDALTGECVIDADACADGTTYAGGECVPDDELLEGAADELEAPEPNYGDEHYAGQLAVPALGDATTLYGCITPYEDADHDRNIDADQDAWEVTTDGPVVLEITVDGIGGLSGGFAIFSDDPAHPDLLSTWRRFGINLAGDTSRRQVYLPTAGSYTLLVADARALALGTSAGDEGTCYLATVEHVAMPEPIVATVPATEAEDNGDVRVFTYTADAAGDIVEATLSAEVQSAAFVPAFITLRNGELAGSVRDQSSIGVPAWTLNGGLAAGDVITYVVDAEINYALIAQDYALDLREISAPALPTAGTQVTVTEQNGSAPASFAGYADDSYLYFDVASAGVKRFDVQVSKGVTMAIVREGVLTTEGAFDYVALIAPASAMQNTFQGQLVRFLEPGRYYFVTNDATVSVPGAVYTVLASVSDVASTPLVFGAAAAPTALQDGNGLYSLDLTDPSWIELEVTEATDWAASQISIAAYDLGSGGWLRTGSPGAPLPGQLYPVFSGTRSTASPIAPLGRILAGDSRDYLVRVSATAATGASPTYALRAKNRANLVDLGTLVSGTPAAHLVPALDNSTPARFIARSAPGNSLVAVAHPQSLVDLVLRRVNLDETAAGAAINASAIGGDETLLSATGAAPNNWIAWVVESQTPALSSQVDVSVTASTPRLYTRTSGAIPFVDACSGGTTLGTNQDDDIFASRTLPTELSGFQLFGQPLPAQHRVSANGWISWDTAAVPSFGFLNTFLPQAGTPNGLIAPFWQDLYMLTLCRKDDLLAGTVTYQWTGRVYEAPAAQAVQFQAILHANGVIDFVYGPQHMSSGAYHDSDGNGATIGVEGATGSIAHLVSYDTAEVGPSTSRTLTPQ